MLTWLARRVVKDAWFVVGTWAALSLLMLLVSLTGVGGGGLFDRLAAGPSTIAGTESARGEEIIKTLSGDGQTVTLQVSGIDLSSRATQEAVAAALEPAHTECAATPSPTTPPRKH